MKKVYMKPAVEPVEIKEIYGIMTMDSEGETEDPMGKQNNMWEESSDPIFESNKKNLWDE